jgi:hypothetical protein
MNRREFITLLGGTAVAWPLAARAQQGERVRRAGVLMNLAADDPEGQTRIVAFVQGLQQAPAERRNILARYLGVPRSNFQPAAPCSRRSGRACHPRGGSHGTHM